MFAKWRKGAGTVHNQLSLDHLLLTSGATFVGTINVPALKPVSEIPRIQHCLPINLIKQNEQGDLWGHCFVKDNIQNHYWNNPMQGLEKIQGLTGVISTDFSMYRDFTIEQQKWNCFKNRVIAYHWQQHCKNVIPTASWSTPQSFDWCWDGLPSKSVLAITTNGIVTDKEGYRLFIGGLDELIRQKDPIALVVCGHFFSWMERKYPNIKMIQIKSFGQLWNERKKLKSELPQKTFK